MGASNKKVMPRTLIIIKKQLRDIKKMLRHNGASNNTKLIPRVASRKH
jgi:hypothetical protein